MRNTALRITMMLTVALMTACTPVVAPRPTGPSQPTSATPATVTPTPSLPATTTQPSAPATGPITISAYYSLHEKMQPVARTAPAGTKAVLAAALRALLAGPSASERARGLSTQIPTGTKLLGVKLSGHVATVNLNSKFSSGGGTLSMTNRLAQVVFTCTQFPGVTGVTFQIDGKTIDVLGGEGIIIEGPQSRADFEEASPAILVESPAWGGALRSGQTVRGTANVFEGVFRIQLRDRSGALVTSRRVQATSGTGTRGTWSLTLSSAHAAAGTGTIRVFDDSPKDGHAENIVDVRVVLKP